MITFGFGACGQNACSEDLQTYIVMGQYEEIQNRNHSLASLSLP